MVRTVYIIQKIDWEFDDDWHNIEEDTPIKAFARRDDALAFCREQESIARTSFITGNLGRYFGGYYRMSTQPYAAFLANLRANDISIPDTAGNETNDSWFFDFAWWDDLWQRLPLEKHDWLWSLFDRVQFYEVIETEYLP